MIAGLPEAVQAVVTLLPALLAGAVVGFLSGMFGIGGGFLIVPVLHLVLRVDMEQAVGTGACQVLGPATASLLARRIELKKTRLPLTVAGGLFVGVFSGTHLLELAKQQKAVVVGGRTIDAVELTVLSAYFLLLLGIGGFTWWESRNEQSGRLLQAVRIANWRIPPYGRFEEFEQSAVSIGVLAWFGLGVGFVAGLLGMSGGLILVPGLIYLLGMNTQNAVASSLVIVWIISCQSTMVHAWHGNVDLPLVIALLLGGTIGARFGSEVGIKLRGRELRKYFGSMLLVVALLIGVSLVRLLVAG